MLPSHSQRKLNYTPSYGGTNEQRLRQRSKHDCLLGHPEPGKVCSLTLANIPSDRLLTPITSIAHPIHWHLHVSSEVKLIAEANDPLRTDTSSRKAQALSMRQLRLFSGRTRCAATSRCFPLAAIYSLLSRCGFIHRRRIACTHSTSIGG